MASCLVGGRWFSSHSSTGEWKPRKKENMIKKENRRGFALGAALAMIASLFTVTPANAAATDGANIAVRAESGPAAVYGGLLTEDFPIYAQLLPGVTNAKFATSSAGVSQVVWEAVETTGLYDIVIGTGGTSVDLGSTTTTSRTLSTKVDFVAASFSASVDAQAVAYSSDENTSSQTARAVSLSTDVTGGQSYFSVKAVSSSTITSKSPNAVVRVTVWIDEVGGTNGLRDADEWYTVKTITLYGSDNVSVAKTVTGITEASTKLTISAVVSGLNFQNLGGRYFLYAEDVLKGDDSTVSSLVTATQLYERGGVLSASAFTLGTLNEGQAISVSAYYAPSGVGATTASSYVLGTWTMGTAASGGASAVTLRMDNEAVNVTGSASTKKVRLNQAHTVLVGATTASGATSVSGQAVSVAFSGVSLNQYTKEIRVNGGAWTSSLPAAVAVTTGTNGWGSFTYETRGFVDGDDLTLTATSGLRTATLTVQAEAATYRVHNDYSYYQTGAGTPVTIGYSIKDQWNVLSTQTHKMVFTKGGSGFNYAATTSEVVTSNGKVSFTYTPEGATTTGSATVAGVSYVLSGGSYVTTGMTNDGNVTVNVSAVTNAFTTGLAGSYSTSISYFPSTLSWATVTANAANTGSSITVTGTGVVFKDAAGNTASGTMTVRVASDQSYTFYATSTKNGTYTMTLKNGSATTTSELIVSAPASDEGVSILWDTTAIDAGKTKIVTGTLVDANGNPVWTDNVGKEDTDKTTASILVTYAGSAGIPVGTMPTETDTDGQFKVSILTSAADSGTFTLTAVYSKDGTVTATDDKITSVQSITVGSAAASSADQKVNAGSFKGYVAIYAKGYEGQRLSAKVGNDWVVVASLASNFERVVEFTGAGYTIAVRIYIDRVLVDTITVTTK